MISFTDLKVKTVKEDEKVGSYEVGPLPKGYGNTLANSLRRVLLSSLKGAGITSVKIQGAKHEYSVIEGLQEDLLEVILNMKNIRFKSLSEEPQVCYLEVSGPKEVKAGDIKVVSGIEVMNKELVLAHLTEKGAKLSMEIVVEQGIGYKNADESNRSEIGRIPLDTDFNPIKNVSIEVQKTRKGQETELDQVSINIETDGSINPKDALMDCVKTLQNFAGAVMMALGLSKLEVEELAELSQVQVNEVEQENLSEEETFQNDMNVEDLNISKRAKTGLLNGGYVKVSELNNLKVSDLSKLPGFGAKSLSEVVSVLRELGIILKEE